MNSRAKKWFLLSVALVIVAAALAAPFSKQIEFRQPDGTIVKLWGEGDEFYAVFETLDGYTVVFDESLRAYCYAQTPQGTESFVSTGVLAHRPAPPELPKHLRQNSEAVKREASPRRARWEEEMNIRERWNLQKASVTGSASSESGEVQYAPPSSPTVGQRRGLTLLIDFSDVPATIPRENIDNFCNGDNYTGYGNNGSVKEYFRDNSNGKLIYSNVVTIYIRVPQPKTYYNDTTLDCGYQGRKLIVDAITAMKALPNFDSEIRPTLAGLSIDSGNRVLALNVFYAGGNGGKWNYGLWPHAWNLSSAIELAPGGPKAFYYQISDLGAQPDLGTFCHENGHMLCRYPDIYDYDYDSAGGAGRFCLMNSGSSGAGGLNPTQICAYLKRASGWATTIEVTGASGLTANVSSAGTNFNVFYRHVKPGTSKEYFLVECRHKSGRDAALPESGIAIWHIDELGNHNNQSLLTNTVHANYEVTLLQADNRWDLQKNANQGDSTDLYFSGNMAVGYANAFSDYTLPNARWWSGELSGINWRSFSGAGTSMSFVIGTNLSGPRIVSQPSGTTVLSGQAVTFSATVSGEQPLNYQWRKNGNAVAAATTNVLHIASVVPQDAGTYSLAVTNAFGSTISSNAILNVIPTVPLAFALNDTLAWTFDSALPWYGQTNVSHDGAAARTFVVMDNQSSWLQTTVTGPGTLSFWWKVSSQPGSDILSLRTGKQDLAMIFGEVDWCHERFYLPAGTFNLTWAYTKDAALGEGQDCAWLDGVQVAPGATAPFLLSQPGDQTVLSGQPAIFSGLANGTQPLSYQWIFEGETIAGVTNPVFIIDSADLSNAGRYSLVVHSDYGSVTSAPALLTITPLLAVGNNSFGQSSLPISGTNLLAVSAGHWHNLAVRWGGTVVSWGNNAQSQCDVPAALKDVAAVTAGGYHSFALRMDGSIIGWGANDYSQTTVPSAATNCIAIAAGGWHSLALCAGGTIAAWGDNTWGQCNVPVGLSNIVAIAAGAAHSLALRSNGTVVAWGSNMDDGGFYAGQSAVPAGLTNVMAIAAGNSHSAALRTNGTVVVWGTSREGELTPPPGLVAVAIAAGGSHMAALRVDGLVMAWGAGSDGQCAVPSSVTNVVGFAAGHAHTVVLLGEPAKSPQILIMNKGPGRVGILARTLPGRACALEQKNLLSRNWSTGQRLPGTLSPQLLLDRQATAAQRFYRLKQW